MSHRRIRQALSVLVVASFVTAAALVVSPAPASAWVDPNCYPRYGGPVVLFWDYNHGGASICLNGTISDMANPATYFPYNGTGGGQRVWDNSASGTNYDMGYQAKLYSEPGFWGSTFQFNVCCSEGYYFDSLGSVTNRNSSLSWVG